MPINVTVNDEPRSLDTASTLTAAIEQWQLTANTFAIAINQQFIPKSCYDTTILNDNDRIEIVTAMQGG